MKQKLRHFLLMLLPEFLLEAIRDFLKKRRRKKLEIQAAQGTGLDYNTLLNQIRAAGITEGDTVLVHSSLSKIGYVQGGVATVVDTLEEAVGPEGTLLMPAFPAEGRNLDYLLKRPVFDVHQTPSRMGAITEYFRKLPGTVRSIHPTDSVCARGKNAVWLTEAHKGMVRPYAANSPFRRLCDLKGKILMIGTTLNGACTNLHTLEDAFENFMYPVYMPSEYEVDVTGEHGESFKVLTRVHNPEWSAKRNADALKPMFMRHGVLKEYKIGEAVTLVIDAAGMLEVMKLEYLQRGVTMYTPNGGKLPAGA